MSSPAKVTVQIDTKLCIGAASCVNVAEKFFELDEDNVAYLIDPTSGEAKTAVTFEASSEELSQLQEAVENCPTSAIKLIK